MKAASFGRAALLAAAIGGCMLLVAACSSDDDSGATATAGTSTQTATTTTSVSAGGSTTASATAPSGSSTSEAGGADGAVARPGAYDDSTDPMRMMTSYVNAINRQEYERAYGYWHNPSQSLSDFKKGYATTTSVVATFESASGIDAATSQRRTAIAAVLDSTHSDGSTQRFAGCYIAWKTVPGVSENTNDTLWHIEEAQVSEADASSSLADLLAKACDSYKDRLANFGAAYDNQTSALNVVLSLYDAINRQDYKRAYGYWEQAPSSYDDFAAGYANTASAIVTTGTPTDKGAAAGSVYERIPVIVTGTLKDGTVQVVSGCYTGRKSDVPTDGTADPSSNPWKIYSGKLTKAASGESAAELLAHACDNAS